MESFADWAGSAQVGPGELVARPPGQERPSERISGADGVHDLHRRDIDGDLLVRQESPGRAGTVCEKDERRPLAKQGGGRSMRGHAREKVGEVFHAGLDHISPAQDAREPGQIGRVVGDRLRAAVGIDYHQRVPAAGRG